jgi:hypothetical protein
MNLKVSIFILLSVVSLMANAISYDSLDNKVKNKQKALTEVQFDEYLLTLKGIEVNWRGKVLDVEKTWLSDNYTIKIDITNDNLTNARFVGLKKEHALTLNKGQEYNFAGEIKSVDTMFGFIYYRIGSK